MPGWLEDHPHVGRMIEVVWPSSFPDGTTFPVGFRFRCALVTPGLGSGPGYHLVEKDGGNRCISKRIQAGAGKQGWVDQVRVLHPLEELAEVE